MGTENRVLTARLTSALLAVCAALPLCTGCGGGGNHAAEPVAAANTHADTVQVSAGDLPVPDGVDAAVWARIVAEFTAQTSGYSISKPPQNEANRVDDLVLITEGKDAPYLTWSYRNVGDYDLNGLVNASDLTPIGFHYGKTTASPDWATAQVADGNGDGEVGLGDITPLGQNYLNRVVGYLLESSADGTEGSEWAEVARVTIDDLVLEAGQSRPHLRLAVDAVPAGHYVRVTPFCYDTGGTQTEAGVAGTSVLPAINRRGDWWMEGRDNYHSSVSSLTGPTTNHLWWSLEIEGVAASGPVVDCDGRIYIGGADGLFIIEPDGGSFQCCTTPDAVTTVPAMAQDGTVYFGCADGRLLALGPDGAWRWSFQATGPLTASPAVAPDGTVWFTDAAGVVYGLDPDGNLREQVTGDGGLVFSPAVDSAGRVYFANTARELYSYSGNGWSVFGLGLAWPVIAELPYYLADAGGGSPGYVQREMLFLNKGLSVDAVATDCLAGMEADQRIIFPSEVTLAVNPPLAVGTGTLFLCDEVGYLHRYAAGEDGSNQAVLAGSSAEPVSGLNLSGGAPYYGWVVADRDANMYYSDGWYGGLHAIDADGELLWSYETGAQGLPAIIAEGTLAVVTSNGELQVFGGTLDGTVPDPVAGLKVGTDIGYSAAGLIWPAANGAEWYEVYRDSAPEATAVVIVANSTGAEVTWADSGLTPGTAYTYRVQAFNSAGAGVSSPDVTCMTRLQPPAEFTATLGEYSDRIELAWESGTNDAGYLIYRDRYTNDAEPAAVLGMVQSWVDTGVSDWDVHDYYIVAFNEDTDSRRTSAQGSLARGAGDGGPGDWRMHGHDWRNSRASNVAGPASANLAWQQVLAYVHLSVDSFRDCEPLFGEDGAIYLSDRYDELLCLNPDGSLRWSTHSGCSYPALLDDGAMVHSVSQEILSVLEPNGENRLDSTEARMYFVRTSPLGLIAGTSGTVLTQVDQTGNIGWAYKLDEYSPSWEEFVFDETGRIYYMRDEVEEEDHSDELICLTPDGVLDWKLSGFQAGRSLAYQGSGILLACYDEAVHALNTVDGSEAWSYPLMGDLAVDAGGRVIIVAEDMLMVLGQDGSEAWSYIPPENATCGQPVVDATGRIYFNELRQKTSGSGYINWLMALDSGGNPAWSYELTGCSYQAHKSIRDDGCLLLLTRASVDQVDRAVLMAFAP